MPPWVLELVNTRRKNIRTVTDGHFDNVRHVGTVAEQLAVVHRVQPSMRFNVTRDVFGWSHESLPLVQLNPSVTA
jgi:hypothetical protein